jgi:hypothetical protein
MTWGTGTRIPLDASMMRTEFLDAAGRGSTTAAGYSDGDARQCS